MRQTMTDIISAFPSHWVARHHNLPIVRVPAAKMTDDEIEFQGDLSYMRALVNAIIDAVLEGRRT